MTNVKYDSSFYNDLGLFFFACPKKNQKKTPENDYTPFSGGFPDKALVLL